MILPIGHENQEVRRLPWVSFVIIALCVVAHIMVSRTMKDLRQEMQESAARMIRYWMQHPYLELDPAFTRELEISDEELQQLQARMPPVSPPGDPDELEAEQHELDRMTDSILRIRSRSPYYRWGLVPKRVGMPGLITHMFIHGGWLHLIGNLLFLYLTGPFIEDIWGRWLYGLFYLSMGMLAGLMFCLRYPHSTGALIGASGAIAAVMGAFLVYFWKTRVRFAFFFTFLLSGTFKAPAWMMLPLWVGLEFLNAGTMDRITRGQGGGGVAHWAHVWGFLFGFLVALVLKWTGFVDRRIAPVLEKETRLSDPGLEAYAEGLAHLDQGRFEAARDSLVLAARSHPGDLDILEYLELAVKRTGDRDLFIRHAARAMEQRLHDGDTATALAVFQRLRQDTPIPALPVRVCALLVPGLLESGDIDAARELLDHVLTNAGPDLPMGLLAALAEPALRLGKGSIQRLRELAGDRPDLPDSLRHALSEAPPAAASSPMHDQRHRQLRVTPAVPLRLGADRLLLRLKDGAEGFLELSRVQAVGVAALAAAGRPLRLLIDLFLDDPAPDGGTLRCLRLASNTFDPRTLASVHGTHSSAFIALIQGLLERSRAKPWPDARILDIQRIPHYPDEEEYQRDLSGSPR